MPPQHEATTNQEWVPVKTYNQSTLTISNNHPHNPYAKPTLGKCFKCNQVGHKSSDCSLRKMANMTDEIKKEEEENDPETFAKLNKEKIMVARDEGDYINYVVQKVLLSPK